MKINKDNRLITLISNNIVIEMIMYLKGEINYKESIIFLKLELKIILSLNSSFSNI
jgi:hypothetical protein